MNKSISILALLVATMTRAQTLSLDDAVNHAIARSPELRSLEAAVAEARANAALGDAFRSSASVATTPGYATGLPTAVLGQVPAIGTIEAHRVLFDRSARADQIEAATQVEAALARLESRKRDIARTTAELYARVIAGVALAQSAQRRVAAYQTMATRTEALRREGRARDLDVDRAILHLASANRIALQAQSRLELDQLRLNRLGGETMIWSGAAQPSFSAAPEADFAAAVRNDPGLRSLDSRIEALQHARALEDHPLKPSVAAQIQYSRLFDRFRRYYLNFKADDLSVGATITLPLWTGGHRTAASARLAAQLQQLIAQQEARQTEIEIDVREAEADVTQALAESDLVSRARAVAEEALRVAEQLASEGRGEVNEVPIAQIALADADDDVANAGAHLTSARAHLLVIRGELPRK